MRGREGLKDGGEAGPLFDGGGLEYRYSTTWYDSINVLFPLAKGTVCNFPSARPESPEIDPENKPSLRDLISRRDRVNGAQVEQGGEGQPSHC